MKRDLNVRNGSDSALGCGAESSRLRLGRKAVAAVVRYGWEADIDLLGSRYGNFEHLYCNPIHPMEGVSSPI